MTPYAEKLLARVEARALISRPLSHFVDSSKQTVCTFRLWEAGFNAFENGIPLECIRRKNKPARQGWLAAAKCREWLETHEFDKVDLQAIVERILWMY